MNKSILRVIIAVLVILLFIPSLMAQDKEKEDTPYWYVSFFKVDYAKIDSLQTLIKEYTNPIVAEAKKTGPLLDFKILIHHTGDEYNVVTMEKYPSWSAIDESSGRSAAFKKIQPDKDKRKEINDAFNWIFAPYIHYDGIYTEATE